MTINTSDTADVIYTSHPAHEVVMKAFKAEKKRESEVLLLTRFAALHSTSNFEMDRDFSFNKEIYRLIDHHSKLPASFHERFTEICSKVSQIKIGLSYQ